LFLPPVLDIYQTLWLVMGMVCPLVLSLLCAPGEPNTFRRLPEKQEIHYSIFRRYIRDWILRALSTTVVCCVLFAWTLVELWPGATLSNVFGFDLSEGYRSAPGFDAALTISQNVVCLELVLTFVIFSRGFLSQELVFWQVPYRQCWLWILCVVCCVLAQVAFSAISVLIVDGFEVLGEIPVGVWVILCVWPFAAFALDCVLWWRWQLWWKLHQLQLKLEFEVRLGMHSPVASPASITPLSLQTPLASPSPFLFTPQGTPFTSI